MKKYFVGISWFILSLLSSAANDVIVKYLGLGLSSFEVAFFRSLFGALTLLPFILYGGIKTLKTSNYPIHILRGLLLFIAMTLWNYGLSIAPVSTATIVSWSIPLFTLVLAVFFLREVIIWQRWLATVIGFLGLIIVFKPHRDDFNPEVLVFLLSAISFSMLDIINKKFVVKESMLNMLFYSALVTCILLIAPTFYYWTTPTLKQILLLLVLGASGNFLLFFILKAFETLDITALAPYRYLEILVSAFLAYRIFQEVPDIHTLYSAMIIIPVTLFLVYSENRKSVELK